MEAIFIPTAICVVLPIAIVLITALRRMNADNKRAQIILKALETNNQIDADKLAESLKESRRTPRELLNLRLLRGCMFTLGGVLMMIVGLVSYLTGTEFSEDSVTAPMMLGAISLAVGVSYLVVYAVSRREISDKK